MKAKILRELAISSELQGNDIRVCLLCYYGGMRQIDIVKTLGKSKQNISTICNKLVGMGLLIPEYDKRNCCYILNKQWTARVTNAGEGHQITIEDILGSPDEKGEDDQNAGQVE